MLPPRWRPRRRGCGIGWPGWNPPGTETSPKRCGPGCSTTTGTAVTTRRRSPRSTATPSGRCRPPVFNAGCPSTREPASSWRACRRAALESRDRPVELVEPGERRVGDLDRLVEPPRRAAVAEARRRSGAYDPPPQLALLRCVPDPLRVRHLPGLSLPARIEEKGSIHHPSLAVGVPVAPAPP